MFQWRPYLSLVCVAFHISILTCIVGVVGSCFLKGWRGPSAASDDSSCPPSTLGMSILDVRICGGNVVVVVAGAYRPPNTLGRSIPRCRKRGGNVPFVPAGSTCDAPCCRYLFCSLPYLCRHTVSPLTVVLSSHSLLGHPSHWLSCCRCRLLRFNNHP